MYGRKMALKCPVRAIVVVASVLCGAMLIVAAPLSVKSILIVALLFHIISGVISQNFWAQTLLLLDYDVVLIDPSP